MSDEPDRQDLEDRVDQLESTIEKMLPSRRDALKLGGAALVGGAAMSGSASAGSESEGTIGTSGAPVDVESEDINNADTITTQDLVVNGSVNDGDSLFHNQIFSDSNVDTDNVTISGINLQDEEILVLSFNILTPSTVGGGDALFMQFNDDTGPYETVHTDGSSSNSSQGLEICEIDQNFALIAGQVTLMQAGAFTAASGPISKTRFSRVRRTLQTGAAVVGTLNKIEFERNGPDPFEFTNIAAHKTRYI